jgi:hypothetical protein
MQESEGARRRIVISSASLLDDVHVLKKEELVEMISFSAVESSDTAVIEMSADLHFDQLVVEVRGQLEPREGGEGAPLIDIYVYGDDTTLDATVIQNEHQAERLLWWTSFPILKEIQVKRFMFQEAELWPSQGRDQQEVTEAGAAGGGGAGAASSAGPKYSSFHCMYGSQVYPGWNTSELVKQLYATSELESRRHRVCVYKDVCFVHNQLVYFENDDEVIPENMKFSAITPLHHIHTQSFLANPSDFGPTMAVKLHSIPEDIPFEPAEDVLFWQRQSQTYNFIHCLIEDLIPVHMAMDIFHLGSYEHATVIHDCMSEYQSEAVMAACRHNIKKYASLLDVHTIDSQSLLGKSFCVPTLVMGHSMVIKHI